VSPVRARAVCEMRIAYERAGKPRPSNATLRRGAWLAKQIVIATGCSWREAHEQVIAKSTSEQRSLASDLREEAQTSDPAS
jgi:hypothetical protein